MTHFGLDPQCMINLVRSSSLNIVCVDSAGISLLLQMYITVVLRLENIYVVTRTEVLEGI